MTALYDRLFYEDENSYTQKDSNSYEYVYRDSFYCPLFTPLLGCLKGDFVLILMVADSILH